MKIISTNLAVERIIQWQGKTVTTGIYKKPTSGPIYLAAESVRGDCVANRAVHGGLDKACYLYGYNHYPFWQAQFPNLDGEYGMLGENLTIDKLEEAELLIGSIYRVGEATVQVSRPRQPCFKFAAKFGDNKAPQLMLDNLLTGTYVRVLEPGEVQIGDSFQLIEKPTLAVSMQELLRMMFHFDPTQDRRRAEEILENSAVSESDKKYIRRRLA